MSNLNLASLDNDNWGLTYDTADCLFISLLSRSVLVRVIGTKGTHDAARRDVFVYMEMLYNPKRKHTNNRILSPIDYENKQRKMHKAGVYSSMKTVR